MHPRGSDHSLLLLSGRPQSVQLADQAKLEKKLTWAVECQSEPAFNGKADKKYALGSHREVLQRQSRSAAVDAVSNTQHSGVREANLRTMFFLR